MKRWLLVLFMLGIFLLPCVAAVGAAEKANVLARANGEVITESVLQERIRSIHRNKPVMRPDEETGNVEIAGLLDGLIEERLMIQEARRVELDKSPDFIKRLEHFVATQSILALRKEEVLDKISVSEEIIAFFKENYGLEEIGEGGKAAQHKRRVEKKLRKKKEKDLSDSFVQALKATADIRMDREFIETLDPEEKYTGDKTAIGHINGEPIALSDFFQDVKHAMKKQAAMLRQVKGQSKRRRMRRDIKEKVVDGLVTHQLVRQEALRRHYADTPALAGMVEQRKDKLLVDAFKAKLVYPLSVPTEKELTRYYNEHIDEFKEGYEVWIREMRFGDRKEADKILKDLKRGASFEFLAAEVAGGAVPRRDQVWVPVKRLPSPVRAVLSELKVGDFSEVISHGRKYKIVKLKGKRGGEAVEFSKVLGKLKRVVGREKFEDFLSEYLTRLRKASVIKIDQKALREMEDKLWMEPVAPESMEQEKTQPGHGDAGSL